MDAYLGMILDEVRKTNRLIEEQNTILRSFQNSNPQANIQVGVDAARQVLEKMGLGPTPTPRPGMYREGGPVTK